MRLVAANDIPMPRYELTPPWWALALYWPVFIGAGLLVHQLPIDNEVLRITALGLNWSVVILVLLNTLRRDRLVTLQANHEGLFFQTVRHDHYFFVPWEAVGRIEKAVFPLNSRGLRIAISEDYAEAAGKAVGNVTNEGGQSFIYTIPQLRNRDRLIETLNGFRPAGR